MNAIYAIVGLLLYIAWFFASYRVAKRFSPELGYSVISLNLLALCMVIHGGRVLVLPLIFVFLLVLLYWAAKPRVEE
jgi:hypothetical protein